MGLVDDKVTVPVGQDSVDESDHVGERAQVAVHRVQRLDGDPDRLEAARDGVVVLLDLFDPHFEVVERVVPERDAAVVVDPTRAHAVVDRRVHELVKDDVVVGSGQARPHADVGVEPAVEQERVSRVEKRLESEFELEVRVRVAVEEARRRRSVRRRLGLGSQRVDELVAECVRPREREVVVRGEVDQVSLPLLSRLFEGRERSEHLSRPARLEGRFEAGVERRHFECEVKEVRCMLG